MWEIIKSHYIHHDLTTIQRESFDYFVNHGIVNIISNECITISLNAKKSVILKFGNVYINRPYTINKNRVQEPLFPNEARERDLSYDTNVLCDVELVLVEKQSSTILSSTLYSKVELFRLPIMVNSCKCNLRTTLDKQLEDPYNNSGYFIIKGKERVLVAQERMNYNQVYVFKQKNKYKYIAEIRCMKEYADYSVMFQCKLTINDRIVFSIPYLSQDIPIAVLFIVLGFEYDTLRPFLPSSIRKCIRFEFQSFKNMSRDEAIVYLSKYTTNKVEESRKIKYTLGVFQNELFPHITEQSDTTKVLFLIHIIRKLMDTVSGKRPEDDRDHICNKRIEMTGDLFHNLIHSLFKRSLKSIQQTVEKRDDFSKLDDINIVNIISRFSITQRLYYCMSTGNWGLPKSTFIRQGVSQILNRLSYIGMISNIRRVAVPIGKESRNVDVRQLHSSNYGFICPVESPEGQMVGIVKNFAVMTRISTKIETTFVINTLHTLFPEIHNNHTRSVVVFVNSIWVGTTDDIDTFITDFKRYRDMQLFAYTVSISYDDMDKEINIFSDGGRILRPVIRARYIDTVRECVKTLHINELWTHCIDERMVVYIDGNEAENSIIAMRPEDITSETEYCEIHPSLMLGICANTTPFPEHSQAPRNVYVAAMMKQAIGVYSMVYQHRYDTAAHVLNYPQKKLTTTKMAEYCHCDDMPSGMSVIVAIMCYTGFNQEDSVLVNQSAIDRGLFHTVSFKTTQTNENKRGTHDCEIIELPHTRFQNNSYNYTKLSPSGIVPKGTQVFRNDVLVGKVYYNNDLPVSDCSLVCKLSEEGVVDSILVTTNASGYKHVKIRIRKHRIPEIGDKLCQVSAQKGTIGMTYRQEDLPFTSEGIVPDIIVNPHAIPSRMTINMLLEMLGSKVSCFSGTTQDASAFDHDGEQLVQQLGDILHSMGYERHGNERMYNGFTGEPISADIFIGPAYYQRLKHLVSSKMHARAFGNVQLLNRQPCAGRSRDGGLRFGEMERDCMIVHGVSAFLKERLFTMSDPYQIDVCSHCGVISNAEKMCPMCDENDTHKVYIPYACKLLFQELQAMHVKISIRSK